MGNQRHIKPKLKRNRSGITKAPSSAQSNTHIAFARFGDSLAIAFGIGGKDVAREFLEKKIVTGKKEEKEDELSPL